VGGRTAAREGEGESGGGGEWESDGEDE